ncbi:MAG: CRISPR-associated endonuclease Cas2 [Hydrogenobaculum sp.]
MRIILFYDIDTTEKKGQRRLQKALKTARKYLTHVQKSVFEGNLTVSGIERLKHEMLKVVDKEKDSLIIYILEDTTNYKREILTNIKDPTDNLI